MISRSTARLLGEVLATHFRSYLPLLPDVLSGITPHRVKEDELNKFLFENNHELWFMQVMRAAIANKSDRDLVNIIAGIHTGETLAPGTRDWTNKGREELGQQLLLKMAADILRYYEITPVRDVDYSNVEDEKVIRMLNQIALADRPAHHLIKHLEARLELDNYKYKNGNLHPIESTVIPEREEQSYLEELTAEVNLNDQNTIKHHLRLSEEHFLDGKWDDSISNSRKVLDAILKQITERVYLAVEKKSAPIGFLKNAQHTREYLERQGLVTTVERETLDKTYALLSVTGGHPYIAEKDQARLMRHLALTFSQFVLLRYQGFLSNNP